MMSEKHNTPTPEAGAINLAPTESEPALPDNTTPEVMSDTGNAGAILLDTHPANETASLPTVRQDERKYLAPTASKPARNRSKKKADSTGQANTPVETPTEAPSREPKKKSATSTKRRSTKPRKKAVKEVEPFEPDLDATPVKPRDTGQPASIVIVPELDSSPFIVEPEASPFTLEETSKRPALRIEHEPGAPTIDEAQKQVVRVIEPEVGVSPFEPDLDPTSKKAKERALDIEPVITPVQDFGQVVVDEGAINHAPTVVEPVVAPGDEMEEVVKDLGVINQVSTLVEPVVEGKELPVVEQEEVVATQAIADAIPETPLPPVSIEVEIPETPLPPMSLEADIPETPFPPVEGRVRAGLAPALVTVSENIAETPAVEEVEVAPLQWSEVVTPVPVEPEKIPVRVEQSRPIERRRLVPPALVLCLLAVFLASSFLFRRDVNDTHLYLYHIDPANGQVLAQQDLGGGYQDAAALTNPVLLQSSLLLGVSTSQADSQHILTLTGSNASWQVAAQHSAPLEHSTLSVTPNNLLVVEHAGGLQVMTAGGQILWQTPGEEPTLGAHAFAPTFDNTTVYTIKAAHQGLVAAYNLRNGATRWMQQLDDTLEYAPPLLLYRDTVFVAGDHTLYALNSATGSILWKAASPTRTLLIAYAAQPLLIAVGAPGLTAFDPLSGHSIWSFNGQPGAADNASVTAAQFYQASISNTNNVIYATGIAWDAQTVQEQLWLFAVDASTGELHWSEPVGSGFVNADAGRIFSPFVDSVQGLVVFEQAQADGSHTLSGYNTGNGSLRWRIQLAGVTAAAPNLIQASNETLSVFSTQTDTQTALRSWSWTRILLLAISIASLLTLLLLWILPFQDWLKQIKLALRRIPHALLMPFILLARLWRFSRLIFALTFVAAMISASILTYTQLNRTQQFLNQVEASSGTTQWQQTLNAPTTLTSADSQGSLVISGAGDHLSQLAALNSNGSSRWTTFSSQGIFSLPAVSTPAGTLLVALSGPTSLNYRYAPDDAAYAHPLDHLFILYLLNRSSGQILWQSTVVRGDELQDSTVLGDDAKFIYIASRSIGHGNMVVQLIALEKNTGAIAWRIFGPREQGEAAPDYGTLLMGGRFIYWQAASTLYALDTELGQIQWRRYIAEMNPTNAGAINWATTQDAQMAQSAGVLLVRRSDLYHALDLTTGNERWTVAGLGPDTPQMPGGIIATGNEFILYGDGIIEAIDTATHSVLWKHQNLMAVSDVTVSADGSLIYAVVSNNLDGSAEHQALVAFDVKTATVHWTFQPAAQALFVYPGAGALQEAPGMLFVTVCLPGNMTACGHQALYGINGATGAVQWRVQATRISHTQVTPDGSAIVFQSSSSAWENLKARFGV